MCGTALRSWPQILNDEGVLGITARSSLHGVASECRHWPLELAFYSRNIGSPLCPSIVARNMANPPNIGPPPQEGSRNLVKRPDIYQPVHKDSNSNGRGRVPIGHPTISPTHAHPTKVGPPMGKWIPQQGLNTRPGPRRPPLIP